MAHDLGKDNVERYVELFEAAEQATPSSRARAERARDYYDSKQWTSAEETKLRKRGQPVITVNRVKPKIDYLLGVERQSRTQAKALPRTPQHEQDAGGATEAIRYVADNNRFDQQRSEVWENLLIEGVGGIEVGVERKGAKFEVVYKRYEFDRIFYDPHSRRRDFTDSAYLGGVVWMDANDAKAQFPDKEEIIDHALASNASDSDTYDDVPRVRWSDPKRNRVRVVLIYRKRPHYGWMYAWFTKAGFLKGPEVSPYYDYDEQENTCPLIFTSSYVDRDGARYGYAHQLLDPQDEYNHRRSRGLHLLNQRQTYGNKQSGLDAAQVKRELSKADGHVEMQAGEFGKDFGIINTTDMSQGNLRMMELARTELDGVGPAETIMGRNDRTQSGRAIIAEQQGAQTEVGPLLDTLRAWQYRVYRATWNRIRQYWTDETWIRVTDDQNNLRWVGLNAPAQDEAGNPVMGPDGQPQLQNRTADLDVDIILDDVPDTANVQAETFQMFTDAVRASGQQVPLTLWLELMPGFPNKDRVLEKLQPDEGQQQLQQQAQMLELAEKRAEVAEKEASALDKQLQAVQRQVDAATSRQQAEAQARQGDAKAAATLAKTDAETQKIAAETAKIVTDILIQQGVIGDPAKVNVST